MMEYTPTENDRLISENFNLKKDIAEAKARIKELECGIDQAESIIREWKSNTCFETPTDARKFIESLIEENASLQASVHNLEFTKEIGKKFGVKGCSTRRAATIRRNTDRYFKRINALNHILYGDGSTTYGRSMEGIQKYLDKNGYSCAMDAIDQLEVENDTLKGKIGKLNDELGNTISKERGYILELQKEIADWQKVTCRKTPSEAKDRILDLLGMIDKHTKKWRKATECDTPEEVEKRIDRLLDDLSRDNDRIIDLGIEIKKLQDRIKASNRNMLWITSNGLLISESDKTVEALEAQVDKLNEELGEQVSHINELDAHIKELSNVIRMWTSETGFKDPVICGHYINLLKKEGVTKSDLISNLAKKVANYENRLNSAKQSASRRIVELNDELDNSKSALEEAYDRITEMEDLCMEYRDQIRTLRTEYEQAKAAIRYYKARIGNAIQAASCAVKHLDTIGYTDPIKED